MIFYTTDQLSKKKSTVQKFIFSGFSCQKFSYLLVEKVHPFRRTRLSFFLFTSLCQLSADLWKLKDYLKKRQRAAELPCTMHSSLSVLLCCLPRRIATKTKPVWFYRMHTNGFSPEKVNARRAAS